MARNLVLQHTTDICKFGSKTWQRATLVRGRPALFLSLCVEPTLKARFEIMDVLAVLVAVLRRAH